MSFKSDITKLHMREKSRLWSPCQCTHGVVCAPFSWATPQTTVCLYYHVGSSSEYYLGFFSKNYFLYVPSVLLMTTESQPVSYYIEAPGIEYYDSGMFMANSEVMLNLPRSVILTSDQLEDKGIYLKTNSTRVTIICTINCLSGCLADTSVVFPIALKSYTERFVYYGMFINFDSHFLIIGVTESTKVTLTVTQSVSFMVGNSTIDLTPGGKHSFVINRLQTVLIHSFKELTGTKFVADKAVSVFSGHYCGLVPSGGGNCDFLLEQIPPTILWSKVYYTAPLATRRSYTIKVLAAYDYTAVHIYCNNTKTSHSIDGGMNVTISKTAQEYCVIISNKQVLVAQYGHEYLDDRKGNSMMILVPGVNQYSNKFSTSTIRNHRQHFQYRHFVNIIVLAQYYQPDMIYLISGGVKKSLDTQEWVPVKVNNVIEAYATKVNVLEGKFEIIHSNSSALMATIVYGFSFVVGYGHAEVIHQLVPISELSGMFLYWFLIMDSLYCTNQEHLLYTRVKIIFKKIKTWGIEIAEKQESTYNLNHPVYGYQMLTKAKKSELNNYARCTEV